MSGPGFSRDTQLLRTRIHQLEALVQGTQEQNMMLASQHMAMRRQAAVLELALASFVMRAGGETTISLAELPPEGYRLDIADKPEGTTFKIVAPPPKEANGATAPEAPLALAPRVS